MLKKKFRIALANAGMTQAAWAKQYKISGPCLSKLLSGKMTSRPLTVKVNRFIQKQLQDMKILSPIGKAA